MTTSVTQRLTLEESLQDDDGTDTGYVEKQREYALRGIPEYWIIDPDRQLALVLNSERSRLSRTAVIGKATIVFPIFSELTLIADQLLKTVRELATK